MKIRLLVRGLSGALLAGLVLLLTAPALAQTTTGTIRGHVSNPDGTALPNVEVIVRNIESGVQRSTASKADGSYVFPGLNPGVYEVTARQIGREPDMRRVRVQIGTTILANFVLAERAVQIAELEVTGRVRPTAETQTSEVATNVSQEQVENLPTSDRNFLDLAVLAPGASLIGNRINDTRKTVAFGAQGAEQINLFIDGATYKNDIIKGGVAGQDASRGNPFPRNAVQEFRVITQNYKAEYQKASSGIITATTRSGGNSWEGNAFFSYSHKGFFALDTFQVADKANNANFAKPDLQRYLAGFNIGGPIIKDKLHFFGSYEGNYQNRTARVNIVPPAVGDPPTVPPALDTVNFSQYNGLFDSPFRQSLFFGKLSYAPNNSSSMELSLNLREETDVRDFGNNTSYQSANKLNNNVVTGIFKYNLFRGGWLNQVTASYQHYNYNPVPQNPGTVSRLYGFGCCATIGSHISIQDFRQGRLSLRDDLTFTGFEAAGSHVLKGGVYIDFLDYNIEKRNSEVPRFVYEPWFNNFAIPEHAEFQFGDPFFETSNTQIGAYLQDDWSPTPRLTFNLGIRWDYESAMINYDYVTPQPVVDTLTKYSDLLIGYPLDPERYFTDGTQRDKFLGAFQPRLGFSYQLDRNGRTTLFGGWGIFYDRTLFDFAIEEQFALQYPRYFARFKPVGDPDPNRIEWDDSYLQGTPQQIVQSLLANAVANVPEVKLLPNDLRPPKSQQFSAGIRQLVGDYAISAAYTGVRSRNVFTFYWANRNFTCPERSFGVPGCFVENAIPGFSAILLADNTGKTWYDALQLQVDRPLAYVGNLGWGFGLAYTFANRETEGFNDDFSHPNPADYPREDRNDEEHRVVANFISDFPTVLWGMTFSGLFTWGTGVRLNTGDRFGGTTNPLSVAAFDTPNFTNLDLRLRVPLPRFGRSQLGLTFDLFNVFNNQNLGCYNNLANPLDPNFDRASCVISDPRRFQIGGDLRF
jgi:hypothetical protein